MLSGGCLVASLSQDPDRVRNRHASCKNCSCICHTTWNPPRCTQCLEVIQDDGDRVCADSEGCSARVAKLKQERTPYYARKAVAVPQAKEGSKLPPKVGRCQHCGLPTRGGKFLPGHDATLKGQLKRAAEEGSQTAGIELVLRGWWEDHMVGSDTADLLRQYESNPEAQAVFLQQQFERRVG